MPLARTSLSGISMSCEEGRVSPTLAKRSFNSLGDLRPKWRDQGKRANATPSFAFVNDPGVLAGSARFSLHLQKVRLFTLGCQLMSTASGHYGVRPTFLPQHP